jgi:hypothetical protein
MIVAGTIDSVLQFYYGWGFVLTRVWKASWKPGSRLPE